MAREKRSSKMQQPHSELSNFSFAPLTQSQSEAHQDFTSGKNLLMTGYAGTGKTYLACAFALESLARKEVDRICIFRSAVPARNIGFLPGTEAEKIAVYEKHLRPIFNKLLNRGDGYEILKTKGIINFESTSFQRGMTYDRSVLFMEEIQNATWQEIDTLVTRAGKESRVILVGDTRQTDLRDSGFNTMRRVVSKLHSHFSHIDFQIEDIVRSDFVREWIIASSELNGKPLDLE